LVWWFLWRPDADRRPRATSPSASPAEKSPLGRDAFEVPFSALDHVVHPGHHWLARIGAKSGHYRNECRPECLECLECLLRLPYVENLDLAVCLEGDVVGASFGGARARSLELANRFVVLVLGEPAGCDVEP